MERERFLMFGFLCGRRIRTTWVFTAAFWVGFGREAWEIVGWLGRDGMRLWEVNWGGAAWNGMNERGVGAS